MPTATRDYFGGVARGEKLVANFGRYRRNGIAPCCTNRVEASRVVGFCRADLSNSLTHARIGTLDQWK